MTVLLYLISFFMNYNLLGHAIFIYVHYGLIINTNAIFSKSVFFSFLLNNDYKHNNFIKIRLINSIKFIIKIKF